MLEQITKAIEKKDYQSATELIGNLKQQEPENPWVDFYQGRVQEAKGNLQDAKNIYLQLLQNIINPKIVFQARQGIERLEKLEQEQRQQKLEDLLAEPSDREVGVLILEPISPELKQNAAQKFAQILQIDPYTARLQLPSRSWRLYRTGKIGELKFYVSSFKQAEIPCFCVPISEIKKLNICQVDYFHSIDSIAKIVCHDEQGKQDTFSFDWAEVTQRVEGLLPLFEEVVDKDATGKLRRKTQTLDYAQICDLHLPNKRIILRISDRHYQFQQGISFTSQLEPSTTRTNWNNLIKVLGQKLSKITVWSDFTPFAQTAIDFAEMLGHIKPHINLLRREETPWDAAFELYSGLAFLRIDTPTDKSGDS